MRRWAGLRRWRNGRAPLELLKVYLGVKHTPLEKYCIDLFFDVKQL